MGGLYGAFGDFTHFGDLRRHPVTNSVLHRRFAGFAKRLGSFGDGPAECLTRTIPPSATRR